MLRQVLQEIEAAPGTVNLNTLAHKLGVERSALEGMIQFWVRKGRLQDDQAAAAALQVCDGGSCGPSCAGAQGCPFIVNLPRTYSVPSQDDNRENTHFCKS
jgi:hypothetical protein